MPNLTVSADIDALMAAANDAAARGELGGTTVGQSLFLVANPSAITFIRVNANNTVTLLSAGDFLTAIGAINGSALNAGNLNAGTVPDARFPATLPAASGANLTNLAIANLVAGVLAGNITLGELAGQIFLDPALSADGRWSGICEAGIAGDGVSFGNICYRAGGKWIPTDASDIAASGPVRLGVCVLDAVTDAATNILTFGVVRADAFYPTMTQDEIQFLTDSTGQISDTAPTTTDYVTRIVGWAVDANTLFFQPSPDWMVHV